jgi:hypothetical protein
MDGPQEQSLYLIFDFPQKHPLKKNRRGFWRG